MRSHIALHIEQNGWKLPCRYAVKWKNPINEADREDMIDNSFELSSFFVKRHSRRTVSHFCFCNGGRIELITRIKSKPPDNSAVRVHSHGFRDHVRVQNDHSSSGTQSISLKGAS